jgi:HTH-type transcriptional regulator / antitoxin HipB
MDAFSTQTIHSIHDAAAIVRGRREQLSVTQEQLAQRAGVSRKWVYEFEAGKSRAEFALVLRVFSELGLVLATSDARASDTDLTGARAPSVIDLDAVLDELRGSDGHSHDG